MSQSQVQNLSPAGDVRPPTQKYLALIGLGMGVLMSTIDSSIVNISLPTLVEVFDTTFATIQWVVLSYVLVLTSFMLAVARLGDMNDKKRIYQVGMVVFVVGSLLCALSPGVGWLIGFRAVQGLGAVMMQSLGMAMVTEVFPRSERGRALGMIGGVVSVGIAIGPPLGGLLIGSLGWHSIFLVNLPIGIIALLIVQRFVPASPPVQREQRFDPAGALILFVTLGSYALGMTMGQDRGFSSTLPLALLVTALIGLGVLLWVESRVSQPMIDLRLFRNPLFSFNLLMGFMVFIVLAGAFIMPFYLELVKGYPTQVVGLMMMANPIAMGLVAPLAGALSDRFGTRVISLFGLILLTGAAFFMTTLSAETSQLGIILRLIPFGMGFGIFQSPNNSAILGSVPRERLGIASGLTALSRTLGNSSGLPLMGAIFTAHVLAAAGLPAGIDATTAPPAALVAGINGTYRIAMLVVMVTIGLAVIGIYLERKQRAAAAAAVYERTGETAEKPLRAEDRFGS